MAFLRRSRAEMVHVNRETTGVEPHVPFGGLKASSNTVREQGKAARAFFTNVKTAYIRSA
jgi:aldehyde dehydrogenase (NAD+)